VSKASDNSHKTAIARKKLSSACQYLVDTAALKGRCLDFGCGRGFDCDALEIEGFDPHYRNKPLLHTKYDTIMCNFVLNVLTEDLWEGVIEEIRSLLKKSGKAYIAVRNDKKNLKGYTSKGTYQTVVELDLPVIKKTSNFVMYLVRPTDIVQ